MREINFEFLLKKNKNIKQKMAILDVEEIKSVISSPPIINIDATADHEQPTRQQPPQQTAREKQQQEQKERTLFCINIDSRTTEDILYELFLQV